MSSSAARSPASPRVRRDGWTGARQVAFLAALADGGSVAEAAAAAGMSRESAYRLRDRRDGALFAILWDRARDSLTRPPGVAREPESHMSNASLTRLLGRYWRWHPLCGPVVGAGCIVPREGRVTRPL